MTHDNDADDLFDEASPGGRSERPDLRALWDDYDPEPAPMVGILRGAHASMPVARPRRWRRGLTTVTVGAALSAAFVAGTAVGPIDGGGTAAPGQRPPAEPKDSLALVGFSGELKAADSCEQLEDRLVAAAERKVDAFGWRDRRVWADAYAEDLFGGAGLDADLAVTPTKAKSMTGTNVQEVGVDEPDVAKAFNGLLVRVDGAVLSVWDVTGTEPVRRGEVRLPELRGGELLLGEGQAVVIGGGALSDRRTQGYSATRSTRVVSVDLRDPARPTVTSTRDYSGSLVAARQHGTTVRLVLDEGRPDLDFVSPTWGRGAEAAKAQNLKLVRATTWQDWVPMVSVDGRARVPAVECDQVALPRTELGASLTSVVGFDMVQPDERSAMAVLAEASTVYASGDRLFMAAQEFGGGARTRIFGFGLEGVNARYLGAGVVSGYLLDRWSIDYARGTLRMAVTRSTRRGGSESSVITLGFDGPALRVLGRVDGLGPDEELKSVRWFDQMAYAVTYREVDPLYAVDLSDVRHPKVLGALKVPGFSEYLHPVGEGRLLGIGQNDVGGAQMALFDVQDPAAPSQLAVQQWGRRVRAMAADDPRQFTWLPDSRTAALILAQSGRPTSLVSVAKVRNGELQRRDVALQEGIDASLVRVVRLPDGRAALVAGDRVEFLDVS